MSSRHLRRRQRRHLNTQLRYLGDRPEILVHPSDAEALDIVDGTDVNVLTSKNDVDPITGMPRYSGLEVRISAAGR